MKEVVKQRFVQQKLLELDRLIQGNPIGGRTLEANLKEWVEATIQESLLVGYNQVAVNMKGHARKALKLIFPE